MSDYVALRAAPGGRLANGLVVDASILARLLGLRLLRLDAQVTLMPASFASPTSTSSAASLTPPPGMGDAVELLAYATRTLDQVSRDLRGS